MQSAEVKESRTSFRLLGLKSEGTVSETGKLGGKQIDGSHRSPSRIVKHMELLTVGWTAWHSEVSSMCRRGKGFGNPSANLGWPE